eukprot:tig00000219_g19487.t1
MPPPFAMRLAGACDRAEPDGVSVRVCPRRLPDLADRIPRLLRALTTFDGTLEEALFAGYLLAALWPDLSDDERAAIEHPLRTDRLAREAARETVLAALGDATTSPLCARDVAAWLRAAAGRDILEAPPSALRSGRRRSSAAKERYAEGKGLGGAAAAAAAAAAATAPELEVLTASRARMQAGGPRPGTPAPRRIQLPISVSRSTLVQKAQPEE